MMAATVGLPDKQKFAELYGKNNNGDLAKEYNVSKETIGRWAKCFKLPSKKRLTIFTIGDKIGNWEILEKLCMNKFGGMRWRVKCVNCGKETVKLSGHINASAKACRKCDCVVKTGYGQISGKYWKAVLQKASMRNINVAISIQDAWSIFEKQNGKCALTGTQLEFGKNQNASLDRIDSKKPYVIDNVQWVHKTINMMKNKLSSENFINWCRQVCEHNKNNA